MKKIIMVLLIIFLIVGCTKKLSEAQQKELEDRLMTQAKEIFETDAWTKGGVAAGTYTRTLKDLKDELEIDISEYKNLNTDEQCDIEKSKIEFVVGEQTEPDKTNYVLSVIIVCEKE